MTQVVETPEFLEKKALITDIMQVCAANNVPKRDDLFLKLAFMDNSELKKMARELFIKVD